MKKIVIVVLTIILITLTSTLAFFIWNSARGQDINVALNLSGLDAFIHYNKGTDVLTGTLLPSTDYIGGISTEIELWKDPSAESRTIYGHLYMNITAIGTNLANEEALKWVVVSNQEILNKGNFIGKNDNDTLELKVDIPLKAEKQLFKIYIWLDESMDINNEIEGETIATIVRAEATEVSRPTITLTNLGLTKYLSNKIPDFNKPAITDEGIYETVDEFGISYYFRGASEHNYVKFAGYYFRIIRINGDGTIRIIYDGTRAHANGEASEDRQIQTTPYNYVIKSFNAHVGYMYGNISGSTYEETHTNINDSTIKIVNDNWYKINIYDKGYNKYVADAIYCNDRSIYTGSGINQELTDYQSINRLSISKNPSLICNQINDKFTVSDNLGNGALTYPVGLITVDEVSFCGGRYGQENETFFLRTGQNYWTMSPGGLYGTDNIHSNNWKVEDNGSINQFHGISYSYGLRPVISLKYGLKFKGDGSINNPFEIIS